MDNQQPLSFDGERMNQDKFNIQEELKKLPDKPGVYIMHDKKDDIIYVGKAIVHYIDSGFIR